MAEFLDLNTKLTRSLTPASIGSRYQRVTGTQPESNPLLNEVPFKHPASVKNTSAAKENQVKTLERMVALYRGILMDGSDYGDLVFLERERCQIIFENTCLKLGRIYAELGDPDQAEEIFMRALVLEPFSENICLELLRLFMRQGKRSKAFNLYYRFKQLFEQELGIDIDRKLTETLKTTSPGNVQRKK
ncbi:MAG: bacterial transcriptional activator domain-containing protein [Desulfitobacteriaceae bacterium]|nr:bacterial transcriptional activator domain-containing protein [Desulfitobacteriaceae bacterium]MDD4402545.1 bacterial transcriptional activator domain-containing protein [Desulfitobacteriaceae bacterium]